MIPINDRKLIDDLGGLSGLTFLITESPYYRREGRLPSHDAMEKWASSGIPSKHIVAILLAYFDRYGHHLDLAKYAYKKRESKADKRPRARLVYRNGRRVLREDLATPMTGILK